jgi:hypothetical protein
MEITIESKYGKVVGEVIERFCVKVHVEGEEKRGFYVINKRIENVTDDDLLKASEEIMSREVKVEE